MANIKLINADCMDIMKEYPDNYFDLAIVDPPYGIFKNKNVTGFMQREYTILQQATKWDIRPSKKYFIELFRISKQQIIWGMQYFISDLKNCSQVIIWDKITGESYFADAELAWCSIKGTARIFKHRWGGAFKDSEHGKKTIQPCQKPIYLYKWLLEKYAKSEYKIIDTHLGSGSSAIAAYIFGCKEFIGIEIDKEYFEAAKNRYEKYIKKFEREKQLQLFDPVESDKKLNKLL